MTERRSFVIVGASLAGAKAAETLRAEGFDGRIVLIGEEPVRPYERPPLSKDLLRGDSEAESAFVHPAPYYEDNGIELRLSTRVESIERDGRRVSLDGGEEVPFDALLLSTGASARRISIPGSELAGVRYLRTLDDSTNLGTAIRSSNRVVVIGAGWIGCEVAASARQMGTDVTMIDVAEVPLQRVLGDEIGAFYRDLHADHGVHLRLGTGVERLDGTHSVEAVTLSDGTRIDADLVVVGVGVAPRVELAEAAGLEVDNGVVTDEYLTTSDPSVFAAGDVANAWHPLLGRRVRLEHWSSALNQGPVAARNMLGQRTSYTKLPYFFSDQYDVGMEYTGLATEWDSVVTRGDKAKREFIAFWLHEGRVKAGMNVNVWDVTDVIASLIASERPVEPALLADTGTDLDLLVKASG